MIIESALKLLIGTTGTIIGIQYCFTGDPYAALFVILMLVLSAYSGYLLYTHLKIRSSIKEKTDTGEQMIKIGSTTYLIKY